jgi:hypothetical protein
MGEHTAATARATADALSPASWAQRSRALPPSEITTARTGSALRSRRRCNIQPISSKSPEW